MRKLLLIALFLTILAFVSPSLATGRAACRLSWAPEGHRHVCYAEHDLVYLRPLFNLSLGLEGASSRLGTSVSPYLAGFLGFGDFWLVFEVGASYLTDRNQFGLRNALSFGFTWR